MSTFALPPIVAAAGGVITDSLGREWDSAKHPRDRKGKFIHTFKRVRAFLSADNTDPWMTGEVTQINDNGTVRVKVMKVTDPSTENYIGQEVDITPDTLESINEKAVLETNMFGKPIPPGAGEGFDKYNLDQPTLSNFFDRAGLPEDQLTNATTGLLPSLTKFKSGKKNALNATSKYNLALYAKSVSGDGREHSDEDFRSLLREMGVSDDTLDDTPDGMSGLEELGAGVNETRSANNNFLDSPEWFDEKAPTAEGAIRQANLKNSEITVAWFDDGSQKLITGDGEFTNKPEGVSLYQAAHDAKDGIVPEPEPVSPKGSNLDPNGNRINKLLDDDGNPLPKPKPKKAVKPQPPADPEDEYYDDLPEEEPSDADLLGDPELDAALEERELDTSGIREIGIKIGSATSDEEYFAEALDSLADSIDEGTLSDDEARMQLKSIAIDVKDLGLDDDNDYMLSLGTQLDREIDKMFSEPEPKANLAPELDEENDDDGFQEALEAEYEDDAIQAWEQQLLDDSLEEDEGAAVEAEIEEDDVAESDADLPEVGNEADSLEDAMEAADPADEPKSPFHVLKETGKSGDGWVSNPGGPTLWGKYGAAGAMIRHTDDEGVSRYLLVRRGAIEASNQGQWQLPGGAIEELENDYQGAAREIQEELGVTDEILQSLKPAGEVKFELGAWHYTNLPATVPEMFDVTVDGYETDKADWFTKEEMQDLYLHPGLKNNLDGIFDKFDEFDATPEPEQDVAPEPDEPVTPDVIDATSWSKVGNQMGTNPGGVYQDADGNRYYLKKLKSDDHAREESLASSLYQAAGVDVAPQLLVDTPLGGMGVASPMIPGGQTFGNKLNDKAYMDKIREGFAVDAWLANYDVTGLSYDNIMTGENGNPIRIDPGGALSYRAQGIPKKTYGDKTWGPEVKELESLRDGTHYDGKTVFGSMTEDEQRESAKKVIAMTPEKIDALVDAVGFGDGEIDPEEMKNTLKMRREFIASRYGLGLPENGEQDVESPGPVQTEPDLTPALDPWGEPSDAPLNTNAEDFYGADPSTLFEMELDSSKFNGYGSKTDPDYDLPEYLNDRGIKILSSDDVAGDGSQMVYIVEGKKSDLASFWAQDMNEPIPAGSAEQLPDQYESIDDAGGVVEDIGNISAPGPESDDWALMVDVMGPYRWNQDGEKLRVGDKVTGADGVEFTIKKFENNNKGVVVVREDGKKSARHRLKLTKVPTTTAAEPTPTLSPDPAPTADVPETAGEQLLPDGTIINVEQNDIIFAANASQLDPDDKIWIFNNENDQGAPQLQPATIYDIDEVNDLVLVKLDSTGFVEQVEAKDIAYLHHGQGRGDIEPAPTPAPYEPPLADWEKELLYGDPDAAVDVINQQVIQQNIIDEAREKLETEKGKAGFDKLPPAKKKAVADFIENYGDYFTDNGVQLTDAVDFQLAMYDNHGSNYQLVMGLGNTVLYNMNALDSDSKQEIKNGINEIDNASVNPAPDASPASYTPAPITPEEQALLDQLNPPATPGPTPEQTVVNVGLPGPDSDNWNGMIDASGQYRWNQDGKLLRPGMKVIGADGVELEIVKFENNNKGVIVKGPDGKKKARHRKKLTIAEPVPSNTLAPVQDTASDPVSAPEAVQSPSAEISPKEKWQQELDALALSVDELRKSAPKTVFTAKAALKDRTGKDPSDFEAKQYRNATYALEDASQVPIGSSSWNNYIEKALYNLNAAGPGAKKDHEAVKNLYNHAKSKPVSSPIAKTYEKDPTSPWFEQPAPDKPVFAPITEKYVDADWLNKVDAFYRERMEKNNPNWVEKPLSDSSTYPDYLSVVNDGNLQKLKSSLTVGRISQEIYDDALAQISARSAKMLEIKEEQTAALKKWSEDTAAWRIANGLPVISLKGMDGALEWTNYESKAWMNQNNKHGQLAPDGKLSSIAQSGVNAQKGSNVSGGLRSLKEKSATMSWDEMNDETSFYMTDARNLQQAMDETAPFEDDFLTIRTFDAQAFVNPDTGIKFGPTANISHIVGSIQHDWGFAETSPGSLKSGATHGYQAGDITMQLRVPAGIKGIWTLDQNYPFGMGGFENERGLILERGIAYYIHSVTKADWGSGWTVEAEIIPKEYYDEFGNFVNQNPFFD